MEVASRRRLIISVAAKNLLKIDRIPQIFNQQSSII
jgi:hypothetical protein